jgi:hypothetical protein
MREECDAPLRCKPRAGNSKTLDRDDDRVNRVSALSGETENVGKFGAPCARPTVSGDSPPAETRELKVREVTGFIGDIPRCDGGAIASTNWQSNSGGKQSGSIRP